MPGHVMTVGHTPTAALVKSRLKRMQYRPGLIDGFLAKAELGFTPFGNSHH
jgi:hypothetical protein